jgi:hypothetical protein
MIFATIEEAGSWPLAAIREPSGIGGEADMGTVSRSRGSRVDAQRAADRYSVHDASKKDPQVESR